jgi:dTDP-4-dehydrorhamnose reductase
MRIAVIGANGQIAQSLLMRAPMFGADIVSLARPKLDLSIEGTIFSAIDAIKPDVVVNAGAYTQVDAAEDEPEKANIVNGDGAGYVAAACKKLNIPIIHISTDYVFDGRCENPYDEDATTAPQSVYGKSKLLGEEKVVSATADYVILRTSWVYSPFSKNFVKTMIDLAQSGKQELGVVDDQFGAPTSAIDLADAIFEIARNLVNAPNNMELRGTFHISGSGRTSWARFARYIFSYLKRLGLDGAKVRAISSVEFGAKAQRPKNSVLNNDKLIKTHGILPKKWQDSVKKVIGQIVKDSST